MRLSKLIFQNNIAYIQGSMIQCVWMVEQNQLINKFAIHFFVCWWGEAATWFG